MLSLRVAVATRCFQQPLKQSLITANAVGGQGVQFEVRNELKPSEFSETGRRQLLHYLDELGLSVSSLTFQTRRPLFEEQQLDARLAFIKEAMQFAFQLKAPVVTARIGRIPTDADSVESQVLCEVLSDLARYGNHIGATFAITPTNESPETLAQLIAKIGDGPLGINFDPATFVMIDQDPAEAFRTLHEFVMHVQIRDALRDIDGSGLEVPVGRGEVGWEEVLALLDEAGYRGWLTVDRTTGDDKQNDVARAVKYLRRVAAG